MERDLRVCPHIQAPGSHSDASAGDGDDGFGICIGICIAQGGHSEPVAACRLEGPLAVHGKHSPGVDVYDSSAIRVIFQRTAYKVQRSVNINDLFRAAGEGEGIADQGKRLTLLHGQGLPLGEGHIVLENNVGAPVGRRVGGVEGLPDVGVVGIAVSLDYGQNPETAAGTGAVPVRRVVSLPDGVRGQVLLGLVRLPRSAGDVDGLEIGAVGKSIKTNYWRSPAQEGDLRQRGAPIERQVADLRHGARNGHLFQTYGGFKRFHTDHGQALREGYFRQGAEPVKRVASNRGHAAFDHQLRDAFTGVVPWVVRCAIRGHHHPRAPDGQGRAVQHGRYAFAPIRPAEPGIILPAGPRHVRHSGHGQKAQAQGQGGEDGTPSSLHRKKPPYHPAVRGNRLSHGKGVKGVPP